jgi:threonine/homoserine/homoserine lactone efflux protein
MWIYLLQGIGYGFAAASQPGPFQTYIISQTLTRGWKRTLPAALAPLISDGPIVSFCVLVLSQVPVWMQRVLYIVGGLFILYLAYSTYKAWRNFGPSIPATESETQQSVLKAALMNALSPNPYWEFLRLHYFVLGCISYGWV